MSEQQSSYRQIMKATTLFGGVQFFNILISIIRSKFVAVLLGPTGMGIMGLLTSTTGIIISMTNFGLNTSAVKDIATAYRTSDEKRIVTVISAFRRIVWFTGLLGMILTALLSPWLSQLTFNNRDHTQAFILLSIILLFNQLSSGQLVILQGMRKLNYLAKANLFGSALGLMVTLPLYFIWGIDGIVPGIISSSLVSLLMSWYFSRKIEIESTALSTSQIISEGKSMLLMGFMISLSSLLSVGASYIVQIFISRTGSVEELGLYNAGFAIINTYVGLIFVAMGTDYYPRLSGVANDTRLSKQTINQQAEISILIIAPILVVFLIFINWVVILLYSKKFIAVNEMIYWASFGMFFKAASWAVSFLFLAKGASKLFFWNELFSNICRLIFNLIGYHFWGLSGLGISFAIGFLLYLLQVYFVSNLKFSFNFDSTFIKIFIVQLILVMAGFLSTKYLNHPFNYIFGVLLISVSVWYSIKELEKRIGILSIIKSYRNK